MSRDATIEHALGDDEYVFRMAWADIVKLQEARDTGPYVVLDRLLTGRWVVEDISEVIRIGLAGGGMDPIKARKMVREYVEKRPPVENLELAQRILGAGMVGAPDEPVGTAARDAGGAVEKIDDLPNGKIRFATIFGAGAAMGYTPEEVGKMSVWHFNALVDGWVKANGGSGGATTLTESEKDEIWDWMQGKETGASPVLQ